MVEKTLAAPADVRSQVLKYTFMSLMVGPALSSISTTTPPPIYHTEELEPFKPPPSIIYPFPPCVPVRTVTDLPIPPVTTCRTYAAAGGAPRDVPHHPSRVWQLWRTKQWSAKCAEPARLNGRQHRHEDDHF